MVRNWRSSRKIAAACITIFLIVQLVVPITRFGDESARRFGWQMFSASAASPEFVVTTNSGRVEINLDDYMARVRSDIDIEALLPPHLCSVALAREVIWDSSRLAC